MADSIDLKTIINGIEEKINARFSSHLGFKKVKAALEKKAGKPDPRAMIMDSRAVFAGDNKPALLAVEAVDSLETQGVTWKTALVGELDRNRGKVADSIEKNRALLENRSSNIAHAVKADEAMFVGRLAAEDGAKPVAGARVLVRSSGADPKIVAEAVTDANGEYIIKMEAAEVAKAGKTLSISYETRDGTVIDEKKKISLASAVGNAKVVDGKVLEDKKDLVIDMVSATDERKQQAMLEMSELKKTEVELKITGFKIQNSSNSVTNRLSEIKGLFVKS